MAHDDSTGAVRLGAVVLAAGAGSRFGGAKLVAMLEGRPVLQHVLDTLALLRPALTVVVVAPGNDALPDLTWREERRLVNPDPARGLSSSLRLGIEAVIAADDLEGVFILLGDQPRTAVSTLEALMAVARRAGDSEAVAVVPRYAQGGGSNPVLLLRAGFPLVALVRGDHGLGDVLAAQAHRVIEIPVPGSNPDVDTPEDLRGLESRSPS